jgi:hypothetical protein
MVNQRRQRSALHFSAAARCSPRREFSDSKILSADFKAAAPIPGAPPGGERQMIPSLSMLTKVISAKARQPDFRIWDRGIRAEVQGRTGGWPSR